jgi:hypothetical protein
VQSHEDALAWARNPDRQDSNFFLRMFSLGLSPKPPAVEPETAFPSVGLMSEVLLPDEWSLSPPFEPTDRILAGDAYWIARRLASVDAKTLAHAVEAGKLDPKPRHWLRKRLESRRRALVARGYERTTPCEVSKLAEATEKTPAHLRLLDRAVFQGFTPTSQRSYRVRIIDDHGEPLQPDRGVAATGAFLRVVLPETLLEEEYFVVQVFASFGERELPEPLEVHVRRDRGVFRLVGVRH